MTTPNFSLSKKEASAQLGLSIPTLDRMIASGELRAVTLLRPGATRGRVRIDETSVASILRGDLAGAADAKKMEALKASAKTKAKAPA